MNKFFIYENIETGIKGLFNAKTNKTVVLTRGAKSKLEVVIEIQPIKLSNIKAIDIHKNAMHIKYTSEVEDVQN